MLFLNKITRKSTRIDYIYAILVLFLIFYVFLALVVFEARAVWFVGCLLPDFIGGGEGCGGHHTDGVWFKLQSERAILWCDRRIVKDDVEFRFGEACELRVDGVRRLVGKDVVVDAVKLLDHHADLWR